MKKYRVYQVDAFTNEIFSGNPAGVVTNAEGMTDEQMRLLARELKNSESAFVFPGNGKDYDIEVRFFTPLCEVPLCGHDTIATNFVLAEEAGLHGSRTLRMKTKAGILEVETWGEPGNYKVAMHQGKLQIMEINPADQKRMLDALGLTEADRITECPMQVASTGSGKVMIAINNPEKLQNLQPDLEVLKQITKETGCKGYYIFTLEPDMTPMVHGRMFNPAVGIPEDPVTGTANGPLGGYLSQLGYLGKEDGVFTFDIVQGEAMGQRGGMQVEVTRKNHEITGIRIIGEAKVVYRAEMEL